MNYMFEKLRPHIGHRVACVYYGDDPGDPGDLADICIECESCNEILVSAEDYDFNE